MSKKVISFHYTLTDSDGVQLESSEGREAVKFMVGVGMIVPGLEKELIHFAVGEKRRVEVKAEEAYGLIDFNRYVQVPRSALPKPDIAVGDVFQSNASPTPFTVKQVAEDFVVLDGNHPLAGEDLTFDVEVTENRDATEEEIASLDAQMAEMKAHLEAMAQQAGEAQAAEEGGESPDSQNKPGTTEV